MRKIWTLMLVGGAIALAGCNTVQGLGEDISSVGECGEDVINGDNC